jgi:hypothetical protein|nr:MAG TPA: zinc-ribbon containing domain protein [Caudoviricetes sp.]
MKEYIERAVALDVVKRTSGDYVAAWSEIVHLPAADVAEVMHGRWVFDHMTGEWSYYSHCSECNYQEFFANEDVEKRHKYCLNCGARMGKEANHGN